MNDDTYTRLSAVFPRLAPDDLTLLDQIVTKLLGASLDEDLPMMPELKAALMEVPKNYRKEVVAQLIRDANILARGIKIGESMKAK